MNGYGERCGNANLVSIIPNLQLKLGYECVTDEQLGVADAGRALRRRAAQLHPGPRPAVRRAQRVRAQGRDARRGRRRRPGDVRAHRPGRRRQPPRAADLRAVGQGNGSRARTRRRDRARRRRRRPRRSSASRSSSTAATTSRRPTARSSCCCARRPATTSRCSGSSRWRVIVEKRADGRVETEATIKIWVDGERYVRTAEGNGPGARARPRAARRDRRDLPAPARHRARQLQGPHPRRDEGHRRGHARAARRLRRRAGVGLDRRLGERDRGLVGGAGRLARVRDAAGRAKPRGETASASRRRDRRAADRRGDPARPAGARAPRRRSACSRCCARAGCRSDRCWPSSSRRSRSGSASRTRARCRAAPPGCTWRCARSASATATRSITTPFSFVASANVAVYERARPVFADIDPVTLNLDPDGRRSGGRGAHGGAAAGARVRLPGRHAGVRAARTADRRGRLRGARRASTPTASRSAPAAIRRCSGSTPTSS